MELTPKGLPNFKFGTLPKDSVGLFMGMKMAYDLCHQRARCFLVILHGPEKIICFARLAKEGRQGERGMANRSFLTLSPGRARV